MPLFPVAHTPLFPIPQTQHAAAGPAWLCNDSAAPAETGPAPAAPAAAPVPAAPVRAAPKVNAASSGRRRPAASDFFGDEYGRAKELVVPEAPAAKEWRPSKQDKKEAKRAEKDKKKEKKKDKKEAKHHKQIKDYVSNQLYKLDRYRDRQNYTYESLYGADIPVYPQPEVVQSVKSSKAGGRSSARYFRSIWVASERSRKRRRERVQALSTPSHHPEDYVPLEPASRATVQQAVVESVEGSVHRAMVAICCICVWMWRLLCVCGCADC